MRTFKIVTRKSRMARLQAERVAKHLATVMVGAQFSIMEVLSDGCYERFPGDLSKLDIPGGGKGAFTRAIDQVVQKGDADIAIHCIKDIPGDVPFADNLTLALIMPREDLRDAVVCRKGVAFESLKPGAMVGTSSVRRAAQIKMAFPYLSIIPFRGNVDTRIKKLDEGEVDALVLARAGLVRLGLEERISVVFEPDMMMPAVGQGAYGATCRSDDPEILALLQKATHAETAMCIAAEREMLRVLQGTCHTPIGGYCEITKGGNLRMLAAVSSVDGHKVLRARHKMPAADPVALGRAVAEDLLAQGAHELMRA